MNQNGYAYGPPDGYRQPVPDASLPQHDFGAAPNHAKESETTQTRSHGGTNQQAYGYQQSVIPGLGLGAAHGTGGWPQSWATAGSTMPSADKSQAFRRNDQRAHGHKVRDADSPTQPSGADQAGDAMDEGEVSEGETEDIYEPKFPDEEEAALAGNGVTNTQAFVNVETGVTESPDRMGSYSPYLSPHELERGEAAEPQVNPDSASQLPNGITQPQPAATDGLKSLNQARKQAQDTILRLWPLNVRYQDYLHEGIDGSIVQELFRDLGFDVGAASSRPIPTSDRTQDLDKQRAAPAGSTGDKRQHESQQSPMEPSQKTEKSIAEERKDRIARLLAAKGSKQATAPPKAALPASPSPSAPSKAQSEKSKLLQQKMEALRKSRASQATKSAQKSSHSQDDRSEEKNSQTPQFVDTEQTDSPNRMQKESPQRDVDSQRTSSIPGLSISSVKNQSTASTSQQKRPIAADFHAESEVPFKRPFGQNRQSRPFLIDVSDDEDDEAMDLDSPEQRPVSADRPQSPFAAPPSRDSYSGLSQQMGRQVSSPLGATPTNKSGKGDLESMNKEIEAMKKRIAEAEARKKTRPSSPFTGTVENAYGPQRDQSGIATTPTPSSRGSENHVAPSQSPIEAARRPSRPSEKQPSIRDGGSRSRSRAASERIPVIEAHRREKLLKLQALQSRVKKMEKEIQESVQEEERLRNEMNESSSDSEAGLDTSSKEAIAQGSVESQERPELPSINAKSPSETRDEEQELSGIESVANSAEVPSGEEVQDEPQEQSPPYSPGAPVGEELQGKPREQSPPYSPSALEQSVLPPSGIVGESGDGAPSRASSYPDERLAENASPIADSSSTSSSEDSGESSYSPSVDEAAAGDEGNGEARQVAATSPITEPISRGQDLSAESPREVDDSTQSPADLAGPKSSFIPYETPMKYFRAYRFHPNFKQDVVHGGLRSLTYSNKIDIQKELCPDQLAGMACPRGEQCQFQHFESIQAPDDQVLLQLGAYGNYEGEQKQIYINGLRQLLTGFRNRKIKDFDTISQGIIDYRAQFRGDPSKILPLGDVSI